MNQVIFDGIYIHHDRNPTSVLAQPFNSLLDTRSESKGARQPGGRQAGHGQAHSQEEADGAEGGEKQTPDNEVVGGLKEADLVGAEGLEPPTSAL